MISERPRRKYCHGAGGQPEVSVSVQMQKPIVSASLLSEAGQVFGDLLYLNSRLYRYEQERQRRAEV